MADAQTPQDAPRPHTLVVDIGGTGTKMIVVDAEARALTERDRELTPDPCTPDALLALLGTMFARQPKFERISVGFPGVVKRGVVHTAPNLSTGTESKSKFCVSAPTAFSKPGRV